MAKRSISQQPDEHWQTAFLGALGLHIAVIAMSIMLSSFFNGPRPLPPVYNVKLFDVSNMPESRPAPLGNPAAKANTAPRIGHEQHEAPKALPPVPKIPAPRPPKPTVEKEIKPKTPPPKPQPKPKPEPKETVPVSPKKLRPEPKPEEKTEKIKEPTPQEQKQKEEDILNKKLKALKEHVKEDKLLDKRLDAVKEHVQDKEESALVAERIAALAARLEKKGIEKGNASETQGESLQKGGGGQINNELLRLYLGDMVSAVQSRWVLPDQLLNKKGLECVITFGINSDGSITNVQFEKKSGEALFDQAALKAVKDAAPLKPIPRAIAALLSEGIGLRFTPSGVTL
jgi:TonB family protein